MPDPRVTGSDPDPLRVLGRLMRVAGPALDDRRWWYMGGTREPARASFIAELTDGQRVLRYRISVESVAGD